VTIIAAADGSALGNPGPAGWAWYVDKSCWASGGWPHGTNNMGELMAVLDLLHQTAHLDEDLLVHCDSTYVINTITKWMAGWKKRGWKKSDGKPVMNLEIIQAIDAAMTAAKKAGRTITFNWVKGHAGHPLNEAADQLANAAAKAYQDGGIALAGPGFAGAGDARREGAEIQAAPSSRLLEGLSCLIQYSRRLASARSAQACCPIRRSGG
jgi:ribonuclease HI